MRFGKIWLTGLACALFTACGIQPIIPSDKHIKGTGAEHPNSAGIPPTIKRTIPLPLPVATPETETYSVVVTNVPAQEILFAI